MDWFVNHYNSIMIIGAIVWFLYFVVLVIDDLKENKK